MSVLFWYTGQIPDLATLRARATTKIKKFLFGVFAVGQNDANYGPYTAIVERDARAAKMNVHELVSPGTAHDWFTEQYGLRMGIPLLAQQWGLAP